MLAQSDTQIHTNTNTYTLAGGGETRPTRYGILTVS